MTVTVCYGSHGPVEIGDIPIRHGGFSIVMLNYQRVPQRGSDTVQGYDPQKSSETMIQ